MLVNERKGIWQPFEQHLKGIGASLEKAQRVLETLVAMVTD
jgi:hypothetical protein